MDREKESLETAKQYRFTHVSLPIRKYVKWECGAFYLPLPNIYNILQMVAQSGGDWGTAIDKNVAFRHKQTIEERREKLHGIYDKQLQERLDNQELIRMIENTVKD